MLQLLVVVMLVIKLLQYWQQTMNFFVTATTTSSERVSALQSVSQRVFVTCGNNLDSLKSVLHNQDVVLLSVGAKGADVYEETYLKTAQNLVSCLQQNPSVKQLIYTGAMQYMVTPPNGVSGR